MQRTRRPTRTRLTRETRMRRPHFASGKARIWENRITPVVILTQRECAVNARCLEENKKPRLAGLFERGRMMGLEPTTFCMEEPAMFAPVRARSRRGSSLPPSIQWGGRGLCRGRPSRACSGRARSPTGCAPPEQRQECVSAPRRAVAQVCALPQRPGANARRMKLQAGAQTLTGRLSNESRGLASRRAFCRQLR
jgi:hypothetical protein